MQVMDSVISRKKKGGDLNWNSIKKEIDEITSEFSSVSFIFHEYVQDP